MAMHRHAAEGKPLFAYFGNARPTYPVFNEFVSHAHFLPQDHEEALAQLDAMVLRAQQSRNRQDSRLLPCVTARCPPCAP
jgi:hypothetical protein